MHTVRMYFNPIGAGAYIYVVGYHFTSPQEHFDPLFIAETLEHAILMVNCLNGGRLPDQLDLWKAIIVKRNGVPPVTTMPTDFQRDTFVVPP